MFEKISPDNQNLHRNEMEDDRLLSLIRHELRTLTSEKRACIVEQERDRLVELGNYCLEHKKNYFEAMIIFKALQDFDGVRMVVDKLKKEQPDSFDIPQCLLFLEDHQGIYDLLNNGSERASFAYDEIFQELRTPIYENRDKFLEKNGTPEATGLINNGIDIIAIRNLAQQYDIAVPIARGGLNQGSIADLFGMKTKIAGVEAHNRKKAKGKWISPVSSEDFTNKKVLLFDKDAVSGATILKTVEMLSKYETADIGVYFTHKVIGKDRYISGLTVGTLVEGLPPGIKIFHPGNAPMQNAGDAYFEANERLGTLYGRRRIIERLFNDESEIIKEQYPSLSESLKIFISKQLSVFDSFNPLLEGISEVREGILLKINNIYEDHKNYLKDDLYSLPGVAENFGKVLSSTEPLQVGFEEKLITARYKKEAEKMAKERNIENPHYPSNPILAFDKAREAAKKGFNIALIVGPEGFAYEPYFRDLGMQTIAVNIPESGEFDPRTIALLDDLSVLRNKKVLVVEDDVRTGATLQKLIEHIRPQLPISLGLYLGQPESFQKIANIPKGFTDTYIAGANTIRDEACKNFREYLKSKGLKIFKSVEPA